jgi:hypothetical protein
METKRYTIFEAKNARLKEVFLGATDGPVFDVVSRLSASPPAAIRHWNLKEISQLRSVEFKLDAGQARAYLEEHAKTLLAGGWRVLTDAA